MKPTHKVVLQLIPALVLGMVNGGLSAHAEAADHSAGEMPNILLINVDDMDFDELSVYDYRKFPSRTGLHEQGKVQYREDWRYYKDPRMLTPNIQSLADDGVTLNRYYVTSAVCTPSRYSAMTGRYASRSIPFTEYSPHGTTAEVDWTTHLGLNETSVPRLLKSFGYHTGIVGKWDIHDFGQLGLDKSVDSRLPENLEKIQAMYQRGVNHLTQTVGFDEADRVFIYNKEYLPDDLNHHNLEWTLEGALQYIRKNRANPFFLYLALTEPHSQYEARYGEFAGADPLATPNGFLDGRPQGMPSRESIYDRLDEKGIDHRNAMATWIDDAVGAVLQELDELNLAENTLVVFMSDHQSRGKLTCYEGSRVPCIIRWPGRLKAGRVVNGIAANIDLAPTFAAAAQKQMPADYETDGINLLPLLESDQTPQDWRKALMLEITYSRAVVTEDWKYIANRPPQKVLDLMEQEKIRCIESGERRRIGWRGVPNHHTWGEEGIVYVADVDFPCYFDKDQLYSMETDVFEQTNVASDPQYADVLEEMQQWLGRFSSTLPHRFGEFAPVDEIATVDGNATAETRALFKNLRRISADKILFGMQHATCYGIGWQGDETVTDRSDVKTLTGSHPAVYGWDMEHQETDQMDRLIIEAYERGGINTISWHMNNPSLGDQQTKMSYSEVTEDAVANVLPGGEFHHLLNQELDAFAEFALSLKDKNGTLVPIIFRPWHEHTGGWFWWGDKSCTPEEYNALWRYTVTYLRDTKKVNNLLYAFSPAGFTFNSEEVYETDRFPGYDYIDILGFDTYTVGVEPGVFASRCAIVSRLAKKHGKVAALTEFGNRDGLTDNTNENWYMDFLKDLKGDTDAGGIAWMLTWRNEGKDHFWVPYPGHSNEKDFKAFYDDPMTVFENDLPDMYR